MALITLAQPGQITVLSSGFRGDEGAIQEPILQAGHCFVALHGDYQGLKDPLTAICSAVGGSDSAFDIAYQVNAFFQALPSGATGGAIFGGFMPGGNPMLVGFSPSEPHREFFPLALGGGLPESVARYTMENLYSPYLSAVDGLDLCVLLGLQFAEVLRQGGYPDGFDVAILRTGVPAQWLGTTGLQPSLDRTHRRLAILRTRMLEIVDR